MARKRTPIVDYAQEVIREAHASAKMEKGLRKYAHPAQGGYMMTVGDLQAYFKSKEKRK